MKGNSQFRITLAAARVNAGLTQEEAGAKARKSKQTIANWENGSTKIDRANLYLLSEIYKCPIDFIFIP